MAEKKCRACNDPKDLSEFHKDRTMKDGHSSMCRLCASERNKKYYVANKKRIKEYREDNKERYAEYSKKYNKANKGRRSELRKKSYEARKLKRIEQNES